jgi:hypothetical protein
MSSRFAFPRICCYDPYRVAVVFPVLADGQRITCLLPARFLCLYSAISGHWSQPLLETFERNRRAVERGAARAIRTRGLPPSGDLVLSLEDVL